MGRKLLRLLLPAAAAVLILLAFSAALDQLEADQSAEQLRQAEEAVRRACVACYAAEGSYPPDIQYLRDRYGLQIDETRWQVHYLAVAQNLMPDITVLPAP